MTPRTNALKLKLGPPLAGTETQIQRAILDHLTLRYRGRLIVWRNSSGAAKLADGRFLRFGCVGSADILGCLVGGRMVALEVKTARGRTSPEQARWLADMSSLGAVAAVVRSVDEACSVIDAALLEVR